MLPTRALEAGTVDPLQREKQPVRVVVLQVTLNAFRAEASLVEGELFPGFEADDLVALDHQLDAALHPAETAMGFDDLVRFVPSGKAFARRIVKVRPKQAGQSFFACG